MPACSEGAPQETADHATNNAGAVSASVVRIAAAISIPVAAAISATISAASCVMVAASAATKMTATVKATTMTATMASATVPAAATSVRGSGNAYPTNQEGHSRQPSEQRISLFILHYNNSLLACTGTGTNSGAEFEFAMMAPLMMVTMSGLFQAFKLCLLIVVEAVVKGENLGCCCFQIGGPLFEPTLRERKPFFKSR